MKKFILIFAFLAACISIPYAKAGTSTGWHTKSFNVAPAQSSMSMVAFTVPLNPGDVGGGRFSYSVRGYNGNGLYQQSLVGHGMWQAMRRPDGIGSNAQVVDGITTGTFPPLHTTWFFIEMGNGGDLFPGSPPNPGEGWSVVYAPDNSHVDFVFTCYSTVSLGSADLTVNVENLSDLQIKY